MAMPFVALAQTNVIRPGVVETLDASKNYVKNPSGVNNTLGITTSSAAKARVTTSGYKVDGIASISCDSSADGGYCEWDVDTIGDQDKTGTCSASLIYKGNASLYRLQVHDGTSVVSQSNVLSNATDWTQAFISFPCSSTTQKPRLTQSETGTGAIVYVGKVTYRGYSGLVGLSPIQTKPIAYTPTFQGFGTPTNVDIEWWREGSVIRIKGTFDAGTVSASEARVYLPSGLTLKTKTRSRHAGAYYRGGSQAGNYGGPLIAPTSGDYMQFAAPNIFTNVSGSYSTVTAAAGNSMSTGQVITIDFSAEVDGWESTTASVVGLVPSPTTFGATVSSTGVLSNILNSTYFNGSTFAPSDTSLFSISFANLTAPPNCQITLSSSDTTANWTATMPSLATSSGVDVRTGWSATSSSFTKAARAFIISCELTGADYTKARNTFQNLAIGSVLSGLSASTRINKITAVSANYTATLDDETIEVDSSGAARTISLPALSTVRGKKFEIVPTSDTNRVIIDPDGSETICGQTTVSLFGTFDKVTVQAGTGGWQLADGKCTQSVSGLFAGSTRTTVCNGSPCTIYQNKGNWMSGVTRGGGGQYTIAVNTGVFGSAVEPECVFTSASAQARIPYLASTPTATSISVNTNNVSGSDTDSTLSFKCSGSR